jgi:hypothetical protein
MRKYVTMFAVGAVGGFLVAGCHDDTSNPPTPPAPSATGLETYVHELIQGSSCDSTDPVQTNSIEFSFAADQDTADPRDVSTIAPTCVLS